MSKTQLLWINRRAWLCLGVMLAMAAMAAGQSQAINGTIRGRVTDASNAAIPAAAVTVTNIATGFNRTVDTGADGYYVASNLPLGTYLVKVTKSGFATANYPNVDINAGTSAVINAELKLGQQSTTVEVTGGAPVVDTAQTNIGRTIDSRAVTNLPLVSRNPYNFILFQPGVSGHPNPELGIPRTVNTNGLTDRINYQLDGMVDTESDRYGLRLFPISNVYVREVQTVSASYAPEFGNTTGDIYNVVTNSGTNTVHGLFNFTWRPTGTSARPLLSGSKPKPDLTQQDFSGNLGGPLVHNKVFLFGAYEHLRRGQPSVNTIAAADATALGLPAAELATLPAVEHAQFLDVRLDYDINSNNQIFFRYNYFRNEFPYNSGVGGLNAASAAADFHDRAHIGGFQYIAELTPNLVNELRLSDPYRKEAHVASPVAGPGPQVVISGKATFNGTSSAGSFFAEKIPSGNDNLTWIHGAHTFKTGFSLQDIVDVQQNNLYTQYTFPTIAAYLAASAPGATVADKHGYSTVKTAVGDSRQAYRSLFWGAFVQDSWQVTPSLLVNYGVRYDRYQPPTPNPNSPSPFSQKFNTPGGDFAPRLGIAWKIASGTVLRADSGVFFDAPPTNLWYNVLSNNGSGQFYFATVSSSTPGAPAYPDVPTTTTAPANPDATILDPNRKDAYTINSSLQLSHQFGNNDAITIGYNNTEGRQLEYLYNYNLINPIGTLADGRPIFSSTISAATRLYPQFNNLTMQGVGGISHYNALLVDYNHRWSSGFQMDANYTWSHALDDSPGANAFEVNSPIEDPTSRVRDYGNSYIDRPNALTISTVWQPTFHLDSHGANAVLNDNMFAFLVNMSSGDTLNMTANHVLNGDSTTGSVTRPLGIGRDTLRSPAIYQIDMRYTRTFGTWWERFQPQFLVEVNNLFNHTNVTSLNTKALVDPSTGAITTPPSLAPTGTVLEARIVQFGFQARW